MDIERKLQAGDKFTPTEQQLAVTILALGDRMQSCSIKELASAAHVSIPSVHRLCKKLGLEGLKELKVELGRASARKAGAAEPVDINFPFRPGDSASTIARRMESVYETTLRDTRALLDMEAVERTAQMIVNARTVDIYTQSHNLYPAHMFCDRLLSAGKAATCFDGYEQQIRTALASDASHLAIAISYSGLAEYLPQLFSTLQRCGTPVVLIGTPRAERLHPGLGAYLHVSDQESLQNRITQFASHIAVQYVLDTLYGCFFARDSTRARAFLEQSLPYTRLPALRGTAGNADELHETYLARVLNELR